MKNLDIAYLGGGCFWCTEAVYKSLKGVISVTPGYSGGHSENPTYQDVASGFTGHAEIVRIEYDPDLITFENLLDVFWDIHDPTMLNRQGNDIGSQYRSIILYTSENQKIKVYDSLETVVRLGKFNKNVVTEIKPFQNFYPAENYHRNYYINHPNELYCQLVIYPKLAHFQENHFEKIKTPNR